MKVSVIIPVFNASGSLDRCLKSLGGQSFRDIEVIFVDDCSTDCSPRMLEEFASCVSGLSVRIIRHDKNRGVAAARNTGLEAAGGDYICFVDADDSLEPDAISKAAAKAMETDADIVGWDWILSAGSGRRYMRQADYSCAEDALKALMAGTMRWNLWLFMVRRSLYEDIHFVPGMNMGEDMMATLRLFMKADRVSQLHESFYCYIQTEQSVSKTMSDENIRQVSANLEMAHQSLLQSRYKYLEVPYISYLKLYVKRPLLISTDKGDYRKWAAWYREADIYAWNNRHLPLRMRLLQKMAAMHIWPAVKAYNIIIYGLIDKLIHR